MGLTADLIQVLDPLPRGGFLGILAVIELNIDARGSGGVRKADSAVGIAPAAAIVDISTP